MEPQAEGLIVLETTFGEIELELFTNQCPKLTRNFVQLCLDGYYEGTIFNRVDKDFIAIGGTRKDDTEEDKLKDQLEKCPDEFHSRLRFTRRGLLASANTDKNANGPEFFFTLGPTPELQGKHSIFGRVLGNSVYCLVDLNECQVDDDAKPLSEKKILGVQVKKNPFPNLESRPTITALIKSRSERGPVRGQTETVPSLGLKTNKKLSFLQDESDGDEESDGEGARDENEAAGRGTANLEELSTEGKSSSEGIPGGIETSRNNDQESGDTKRSKIDDNPREKRLREVREEFERIKKQLACDSAIKIKTLSERRGESSKREAKLSGTSLDGKLGIKRGRDRERERETLEGVRGFKEKLKKVSVGGRSGAARERARDSSIGSNKIDIANYDFDDVKLCEELESVDDDSWLEHRFEAAVGGGDDGSFSKSDYDDGPNNDSKRSRDAVYRHSSRDRSIDKRSVRSRYSEQNSHTNERRTSSRDRHRH